MPYLVAAAGGRRSLIEETTAWLTGTTSRRRWPLAAALLLVASGLAYSFAWAPLVRHQSAWVTPGDLWATYRAARWVSWGALGDVYGAHTSLVTFPGILLVMAPVAMLCTGLGLFGAFPITVAHPTSWILIGPVTLLMSTVPLCGLDRLAEVRGVGPARRLALTVLQMVLLWPMLVLWGHPEDALAIGLVAYSLAAGHRSGWRTMGWTMGAAVVMQPLSLLAFPVVLAWAPRRTRVGVVVRSGLMATVMLLILLAADFSDTWRVLTRQPNYPGVNHPTPWARLSPSLGNDAVAAGPGRVLAIACAVLVGLWVWNRRKTGREVDMVWAAALVFTGRCVFEPVMVPYYVTPALALMVFLAAEKGRLRLAVSGLAAIVLTVALYVRAGPVLYWLVMAGTLAGLLLMARWKGIEETRQGSVGSNPAARRGEQLAVA